MTTTGLRWNATRRDATVVTVGAGAFAVAALGVWIRSGVSVPTSRIGLVAASIGGLIYAMGGRSGAAIGSGTLYDTNEVYDPSSDTWTEMSPMPA